MSCCRGIPAPTVFYGTVAQTGHSFAVMSQAGSFDSPGLLDSRAGTVQSGEQAGGVPQPCRVGFPRLHLLHVQVVVTLLT